jgi:hypothetical protein
MYTTNQIADFFPSDRAAGDTNDPEGWVQAELNAMDASITTPRTTEHLDDNDGDDENHDGDLGVIRQHSYLRGIRAIASLYELFEQTVAQPIAYVKIQTVEELDDHDYACTPFCFELTEADFFAQVSVAGLVAQNAGDKQTPDDEVIHPNWNFGQNVGLSGSVPMWIEIWDEDDFLAGADDQSNITAGAGRRLDFSVDLAACLSGAGGAVSGGNINGGGGACGQPLTSNVSGDDDDDGDGIARVTFSVHMSNVPPTADAGGPYTVPEGGSVVLSGAASSDPNQPANTLTYEWDLDNNGVFETPGINPTFSAAGLDGPSSRTVRLRVTDNGGLTDTDEATVSIQNVPPDLQNVAVTAELNENGVATLTGNIVDPGVPDTFTLVVNWGEGSPVTYTYPAGTTSFSETHPYLDDNPTATAQDTYNISLLLSDDDGGTDSAVVSTLVKNVNPVITAFSSDAEECGERGEADAVHVTGMFTDVGTLDSHTATISWGDGMSTAATIVAAGGVGTIAAEHVYASGGIFRIEITLNDDDMGQATDETFALVTGVGILDGQLQVVGTKLADDVNVSQEKNGSYKVHASFIDDSPRSLPGASVTSIAMILCAGDDHANVAGNLALPTYINAEEGDDLINGGAGPNIFWGGEGDDRINGGKGQDILVGGDGADRIVGSGGDDILIAGTLGGDDDPIKQLDEMLALVLEWETDRNPTLLRPKLTISGDDDEDKLTGSSGWDWYFFELGEDIANDLKKELSENLG